MMLMIKMIGSIIVILCFSMMGLVKAKELDLRVNQLKDFISQFQILETQVSFMSNILSDAFEYCSKALENTQTSLVFKTSCKLLKEKKFTAAEAWYEAVQSNIKFLNLTTEDYQILNGFGNQLGNPDAEGQVNNIKFTLFQLTNQLQKAEESRTKNKTLYANLGVLCGVGIVIILS